MVNISHTEDSEKYVKAFPILEQIFENIIIHEPSAAYRENTMFIYCDVYDVPTMPLKRKIINVPNEIVELLAGIQLDRMRVLHGDIEFWNGDVWIASYIIEDNVLFTTDITHVYTAGGVLLLGFILSHIIGYISEKKVKKKENKAYILENGIIYEITKMPVMFADKIEEKLRKQAEKELGELKEAFTRTISLLTKSVAKTVDEIKVRTGVVPESPTLVYKISGTGEAIYARKMNVTFSHVIEKNKTKKIPPKTFSLWIAVRAVKGVPSEVYLWKAIKSETNRKSTIEDVGVPFIYTHTLDVFTGKICTGDFNISKFLIKEPKDLEVLFNSLRDSLSVINLDSPAITEWGEVDPEYGAWLKKALSMSEKARIKAWEVT